MKTWKEVIDGIRKAIMASEVREDIAQMGEYVEQFANTAGENIKKAIDPTLSVSGKAADARATGAAVDKLEDKKADKADLDTERKRIDVLNNGGLNLKDDVIDTSIKAWLEDHPEATTTVQDGSIDEKKINKKFLPWIKKDYVTPEMFGAVGDGVTDDHKAMQNAIDYASDNGLTLTILGKNYVIKDTLNITKRVTIAGTTRPELWIEGSPSPTLTFLLSGTKPAIKVDYYKDSDYKNVTTPPNTDNVVIKNLKITGNNQSFCGIVTRCYLSDFENLTIERFTIGVYTHQTYKVNFRYVTTFYCDVGFFVGVSTYFNTNLIDCLCQYNNTIQNNSDASELINETLTEKFYNEKITGIYVYNSECRLIRFSTEAVFYGIYATDGANIYINDCGIELIPNEGYGIIASGELNPSTVICDNVSFWNNESYTGGSAFCGYRNTVIITNASTTNFKEASQSSNINACLVFKTINGDRYIPVQVSGLTGANVTNNRSRYNGDGTFTYDFVLNYTSYDSSTPIKITGGPTLGVEGDAIVLNTDYTPLHCLTENGTLTTSAAHNIYAYPESGTRLCYTVTYNF